MKKNKKLLLVSALLGATLGLSAVAVGCGGGDYKLSDFVVNTEQVTKVYTVGEEVDFSKLAMTATFSDGESEAVEITEVKFYLNDVDVTADLLKITETAGKKTIKVVYTTKYGEDFATFTITVNEDEEATKNTIESFSTPQFYVDYQKSKEDATNDSTASSFEGSFFKNEGSEYYVVGDDNPFKFLPVAVGFNADAFTEYTMERFVASSTVSVLDGENFVALTKGDKAGVDYAYEYKQGDTLLVTEAANNNEFQFTSAAVGKVFKLNVKPNETYYEIGDDVDAEEEIVVKVVDAYNVYEAKQLSVIDNTDNQEWAAIKGSVGVTQASKNANGVVFHSNIQVTAADIPEAYQYTLSDSYAIEYKRTNEAGQVETGKPEDFGLTRTFLWNMYDGNPDIYRRVLTSGQSFNFYGNYFDLDLSKMPLVASFEAEGVIDQYKDEIDRSTWYGNDFSNTSLFVFEGTEGTGGEADESLTFVNLNMKGNAKTEQLVVTDKTKGYQKETLVYGGSLIFAKVMELDADYDNIRMQHFFISLFAETNATVDYNRTKCYDSFQDALYVWSKAEVNITNSYFQRAGGPLIIMNHEDPDEDNPEERIPTVTIGEECVMESYLTGTEIWFGSVGADSIMEQFIDLDKDVVRYLSTMANAPKSIYNENGQMNIVVLLMRDATDAATALTAHETQGYLSYGDAKLDRMFNDDNPLSLGNLIHDVSAGNLPYSLQVPLFNFGNNLYFSLDGDNISMYNEQREVVTNQQVAGAMAMDLKTSDYIGVSQGGFSILFGLMPYELPAEE